MDLDNMSLEELVALKKQIENRINELQPKTCIIRLEYDDYKDKTWVAKADPETNKIQEFIKAISKTHRGKKYRGYYTYELCDGYYVSCELGKRDYFFVVNREIAE